MLPPKEQMQKMSNPNRFQDAEEQVLRASDFGPPQFNDNNDVFDNDDLESTYQQFDELHLEQPYEDDEEVDTMDEERGFAPPPKWEGVGEHPVPPSLHQPGNSFLRDEPIFPGGPSRSEVASWKKQFEMDGHQVLLSSMDDGENFIWRTLNREEYREIMALPNVDPLQREEIICEICILFPYEYDFSKMSSKKAGVPAVLAQDIMKASGFKKPAPPIRL